MTWRPPVTRACLIVKRTEGAVGRLLRLSCRHPLATGRAESMVWCRARRSADAGGRWVSLMSARAHRRARGFTNVNEGGKPPDAGLIPRRPSIVKAAGCICGIWPVQTQATGMSVNPHSLGRANGYRLSTVSTVGPVRDQPNLLRDFFGREDEVDAATFYCALRHIRLNGCIELLGNRDAPNIFDAT